MPYSLLPVTILVSNQILIIKTHDMIITVTGKGLDKVDDALSSETLLYIRQNVNDYDDGSSSVFIKDIQCEGDLLTY